MNQPADDVKQYKAALKAIKMHCLICSGDDKKEVEQCKVKDCKLLPYRLGTLPDVRTSKTRKRVSVSEV